MGCVESCQDGFFRIGQLLEKGGESVLYSGVFWRVRECCRPIQGTVEVAAAVVELVHVSRGRVVLSESLSGRLIECLTKETYLGGACLLCKRLQ